MEEFIDIYNLRIQSIRLEGVWQEHEAVGYIVATLRTQRRMNAGTQLVILFTCLLSIFS